MIEDRRGALEGQDLFICATGPSILDEDTHLLNGKTVMGISELFNWSERDFDCQLWGWHVANHRLWLRYIPQIEALPRPCFATFAVGLGMPDSFPKESFHMIPQNTAKPLSDGYCGGISKSFKWVASSPCTGLMVGVQPAIWLHPKNIYLLGFDHTSTGYAYSPGPVKRRADWSTQDSSGAFADTMRGLKVLQSACNKQNINLVNLSQGSADTVLPKARLRDVV